MSTRTTRTDANVDLQHAAWVREMSRQIRKALVAAMLPLDADVPSTDLRALTVERADPPVGPARLAREYPGDAQARQQACALYERCLRHYREVLRASHADIGCDDVSSALACFVVANVQALQGINATPETLLRLERQLGAMVQRSAAWASASAREQQCYFEQLAILAVLIGESSAQAVQQGAAAVANVQRAARGYLQQLLGLNPDLLTVGPDGIGLRLAHDGPV